MTNKYILSASHIGAFKVCPMRYNLRYVKGLKPSDETESQRYGTNWHKILEIVNLKAGDLCPDCQPDITPDCPICTGAGIVPDGGMDAVIRYLDATYAGCPMGKSKDEWEVERIVLLYSLIGYNWYYAERNKEYKVVAQEIEFQLPLRSPGSGRNLANTVVQGRIDKLLENTQGKLFVSEHKSTAKGLDPDSSYWKHLVLDCQTTLYPYVVRNSGDIQKLLEGHDTSSIGVLFDVWHRPGIKPSKLTQADSKTFVETGGYCGQKFEVTGDKKMELTDGPGIIINGVPIIHEPGKKEGTFAIKETPEMFGARLLQDITERPEFYFCTKEIARTDADLIRFEKQLFNIYQAMKMMTKSDGFWCDENQCEATFKCPFTNICYNNIEVDPANPPEGFTSRFQKKEGE
ncbi:MAG: PD-(D/E)XK nuclease family protein [Thermoplasmata archaeon]|nr:PD-(D/E)XK nuclease family protein [Thermoplasmata archaeon]